MPGPPPTPKEILRQRGSWRGKERPDEPRPEHRAPVPPPTLTAAAVPHWESLVAALMSLGVLTECDQVALAQFAEDLAEIEACDHELSERGLVISDDKKSFVNPLVRIRNEAKDRVLRYLKEFGLTPSARTRVSAKPREEPKDDKARFLRVV